MRNSEMDPIHINLSEKELLSRMYRYCAFQERSEFEVRHKLEKLNADALILDAITKRLKDEGFLNEERFIRTYVLGKLRNKQWGRIKIRQGLKEKTKHEELVEKQLSTVEKSEYLDIIRSLIKKKKKLIRDQDVFILKNKIARYLISKGFEADLVWDQINITCDDP